MENLEFKLIGSGYVYEYYLKHPELHQNDFLIIVLNDINKINEALYQNIEYKNKVVYCELVVSEIDKLYTHHLLIGYVNGDISNKSYIIYSGNVDIFNHFIKISANYSFLSNLHEAAIINSSIVGIHYTYLLANIVGLAMCKKYSFNTNLYKNFFNDATPKLCEGAYRNIWNGLSSDQTFSDVDDDIHAMEMLVNKMKNSNAYNQIFNDSKTQLQLNNMLSKYWTHVSKGDQKNE